MDQIYADARFDAPFGPLTGYGMSRPAAAPARAVRPDVSRDHVTVLFVDIEGFTRLTELLPLERTAEILTQYYATLLSTAHRTAGTADRFVGDGGLIYWSRSRNGADHAIAALSAVRLLREELARGGGREKTRVASGLPIRFGVHSGDVMIGRFGESAVSETLLGDVVNVAFRLQQAARALPRRAEDDHARGYVSRDTCRLLRAATVESEFDRLTLPGRKRAILARRF